MMNDVQKSIFLLISLMLFLLSCEKAEKKKSFQMKEGDLLFQDTGTDEIDNAIKSVTATSFSKNYSHVGMAMLKNQKWHILEAIPQKGVVQTPLQDFLNRNKNSKNSKNENANSQTTVARLKKYYQKFIPKAIEYGIKRLKTPYDDIFLWDDNAYYCSELIYKMFFSQNIVKDSLPFLTHPMTFNDSFGKPLPSWTKYYKNLNHAIPEGDEGTNPNLMASSPHLQFIYDYAIE